MYFTWADTIRITEDMFGLNSESVALRLGANPSTISRIKSGKIRQPNLTGEKWFTTFFDPEDKKNPAKGSEKSLLSSLKDFIDDAGFKEVMQDLWDKKYEEGDYKAFVLKMVKETKNKRPSKEKSSDKIVSQSKMSSEQMIKIFEQAVLDHSIAGFINCALMPHIKVIIENDDNEPLTIDDFHMGDNELDTGEDNLNNSSICGPIPLRINVDDLFKVNGFLSCIESKIINSFVLDQKEHLYQLINDFYHLLGGYNELLLANTFMDNDTLFLKNRTIEQVLVFESEADNYRMKISSLHKKICGISLTPPLPVDNRYDDEGIQCAIDDLFSAYK